MNVYKPLIIFNVAHPTTIMTDSCTNFRKFLVEGTEPNLKKIHQYAEDSLMLVTALSPVIGYDKASKIAHYAMDNDRYNSNREESFFLSFRPGQLWVPHISRFLRDVGGMYAWGGEGVGLLP